MIKSLPPLIADDVRRIRAYAAVRVAKAAKEESADNDAVTILRLCEALAAFHNGWCTGDAFWTGVMIPRDVIEAFEVAKTDMETRRDSHPQGAYVQPDVAYGDATIRLRNATAALCVAAVEGLAPRTTE